MFGLSAGHLIVLLVIVVLIFGTSRLKTAGKDLGDAVRGFRQGLQGDEDAQRLRDERRNDDVDSRSRDTSDTDRDRR
ncbi:twin-arginine translocase TatA/TatE family subunit [Lysobacter sp. TY2-98]|uniref:twin-arginine translocase TatA/TatE family subunit n=1 Tax=Lysobacter sp. TY2-98 TaxID=2290922 RepID=UPI000E20B80D|nr:twin-arginine translocase TatA/TatE family subunit [Lysobacter sp. TY2-98]AXK73136.1 twin-arginine translocase TatA/TatE family subunit [Lysobacter sp. TY2-98]